MTIIDPIELAQELIRCPSITPADAGALKVLQKHLESLGFKCQHMTFSHKNTADVDNLYARFGSAGKNLCFAGHTDVVPVGDEGAWTVDPFEAKIKNRYLIGRGVSDMKGAIAAWVAAASIYLSENKNKPINGSLSLLITGDEEGPSINGTKKVLKWLKESNREKIDACIVGEPTNPKHLGEMIKIGRRGSINFNLTVFGVQGHSAYPHLADNPIPKLMEILGKIKKKPLDKGTEYFDSSNLEITSIDTGNIAANVIPAKVTAKMNIRFNDLHTGKSLTNWMKEICDEITSDYDLTADCSGESFITKPGKLSDLVMNAVENITGVEPVLSTSGGTSDARFIKDYCPVVEFGLTNETAHKVDERARIEDIEMLTKIYLEIIRSYF